MGDSGVAAESIQRLRLRWRASEERGGVCSNLERKTHEVASSGGGRGAYR